MQVNEELSTLVGPHLPADRCPLTYFVLNVANPLIFAVVLPLHELVVYPVFHKYINDEKGCGGICAGCGSCNWSNSRCKCFEQVVLLVLHGTRRVFWPSRVDGLCTNPCVHVLRDADIYTR